MSVLLIAMALMPQGCIVRLFLSWNVYDIDVNYIVDTFAACHLTFTFQHIVAMEDDNWTLGSRRSIERSFGTFCFFQCFEYFLNW